MRKTITLSKFGSNLKSELDSIEDSDAPIVITRNKGKGNIVVISEAAFSSMVETGYLLSTESNRTHLRNSLDDLKAGRVISIPLDKLWK